MKKIGYLLLVLIAVFSFQFRVGAASSKFESTVELETEVKDNQIIVYLGYINESINDLTTKFAYDTKALQLVSVDANVDFNVEKTNRVIKSHYEIIDLHVTTEDYYADSNYATITFNIKNAYKVKKATSFFLYDTNANGMKYKYRAKSLITNIKRETEKELLYSSSVATKWTKIQFWIVDHIKLIIYVCSGVFILAFAILIIPSTRRGKAEEKVKEQLEEDNENVTSIFGMFGDQTPSNNTNITDDELPKKKETDPFDQN